MTIVTGGPRMGPFIFGAGDRQALLGRRRRRVTPGGLPPLPNPPRRSTLDLHSSLLDVTVLGGPEWFGTF